MTPTMLKMKMIWSGSSSNELSSEIHRLIWWRMREECVSTGQATHDEEVVRGPVEVLSEREEEVVGVELDEAWSLSPKMCPSASDSNTVKSTPKVPSGAGLPVARLAFFIPTKSASYSPSHPSSPLSREFL